MDTLDIAREVTVLTKGPKTVVEVPTAALWVLVIAGLGMLTFNAYLTGEQIKALAAKMEGVERRQDDHVATPSHEGGARYLLDLSSRVNELESGDGHRHPPLGTR